MNSLQQVITFFTFLATGSSAATTLPAISLAPSQKPVTRTLQPILTAVTDSKETATSMQDQEPMQGMSLSARRAECFQSVNLTHPPNSLTCNTSLLVHYSLMEVWTHQGPQPLCQMVCQHIGKPFAALRKRGIPDGCLKSKGIISTLRSGCDCMYVIHLHRQRDVYGEVMQCVLEATKSCLPPENRLHFPDQSRVKGGLHYICNVAEAEQFDVNITCARSHFREVFDCVQHEVQSIVGHSFRQTPIPPHLICRTYDIADLCCWENLQTCGEETAAAYTRLMSLYLRPPSCNSSAINSVSCFSFLILLFAVSIRGMLSS